MRLLPDECAWTHCFLAAAVASAGALAGQALVIVDTSANVKIVNKQSNLVLGLRAGAKAVPMKHGSGGDCQWHFLPAGNNRYKIVNLQSGALLGVAGAAVVRSADTGSKDHLWEIIDAGGGYYKIANGATGLVLAFGGHSAVQQNDTGVAEQLWKLAPSGTVYPAPITLRGDVTVHDPSMVRTGDGTYYLFGTHGGIRMSSSADRSHFTAAGQAFAAIPSWVSTYNRGDLWAPDVSGHNGKYWLYYAASRFGENTSAIGLATSQNAAPASWSDQGIVYSSQASDNYNAIDPGLRVDTGGKWWLSFGSFWGGIMLIEIDPANGKQASWNQARYPLARRPESPAIEGAYIYPHDKRYYLFASLDQCCRGANSTYHVVVGRSKRVTGPYYDRSGIAMSQGGGTIVLSSHGNVVGPGGQVVFRDGDEDFLIYHYYDGGNKGRPTLGMNRIQWDSEGWPHIQ